MFFGYVFVAIVIFIAAAIGAGVFKEELFYQKNRAWPPIF